MYFCVSSRRGFKVQDFSDESMGEEHCPEFEGNPFTERLIKLRRSDPAAYLMFPQDVRDLVEGYEREGQAKQKWKRDRTRAARLKHRISV